VLSKKACDSKVGTVFVPKRFIFARVVLKVDFTARLPRMRETKAVSQHLAGFCGKLSKYETATWGVFPLHPALPAAVSGRCARSWKAQSEAHTGQLVFAPGSRGGRLREISGPPVVYSIVKSQAAEATNSTTEHKVNF
jgi:hypothetical protein